MADGASRRCTSDDDVDCCMQNVALPDVLPSACRSLRCLAHDLCGADDAAAAQAALTKHDRHIYLLLALTVALLVAAWAVPKSHRTWESVAQGVRNYAPP